MAVQNARLGRRSATLASLGESLGRGRRNAARPAQHGRSRINGLFSRLVTSAACFEHASGHAVEDTASLTGRKFCYEESLVAALKATIAGRCALRCMRRQSGLIQSI
jgi:hypothetical protein